MAVSLLLSERVWPALQVIADTREVERAEGIEVVIKSTTAPVRNVNAPFDQVFARRVRKHLRQLRVVFGPQIVGLGAASGESVKDHDLTSAGNADVRLSFVTEQKPEVTNQSWREYGLLSVVDFLFHVARVEAGLRQNGAARVLVVYRFAQIRVAQRNSVGIAERVTDLGRELQSTS